MEPTSKRARRPSLVPQLLRRDSPADLTVLNSRQAAAKALFVKHDANGDGVLERAELLDLLGSLGAEHAHLHPHYIDYVLNSTAFHDAVRLPEFIKLHGRLAQYDELLRAPKLQMQHMSADPIEASQLREIASLACPPLETREVKLGGGTQSAAGTGFTIETRYGDVELIGEGAFGMVCAATDTMDGSRVAIKKMRPTEDVLQLRCCLRELAIMRHLGEGTAGEHENLLGLRRVLAPPAGPLSEWRELYWVTALLDTDLHQGPHCGPPPGPDTAAPPCSAHVLPARIRGLC